MSRIGRLPVSIPSGVDITIDGQTVKVKGPKGELSHRVAEPITVEKGDEALEVKRPNDERQSRALHGLTRSLINNMVLGVTEGYIASWKVEDAEVGKTLTIELKYGPNRERSIAGVRRVSKPGLRVYAKSTNLPKVLGGLGVAIISTSSGLLTDRQAATKGVGGEVLAYVW
jgi:ribosomal protein S8